MGVGKAKRWSSIRTVSTTSAGSTEREISTVTHYTSWSESQRRDRIISITKPPSKIRTCLRGLGKSACRFIGAWRRMRKFWNTSVSNSRRILSMGISAKFLLNRRSRMKHGFLSSLGLTALASALTVVLLAPLPAAAQAQRPAASPTAKPAEASKPWTVSKTPDGVPDLQGYWTNNSYTPLERPQGVTKEFYTPAELKEAEKKAAERE